MTLKARVKAGRLIDADVVRSRASVALKNRHVQFTATAQEHVRREKAWWLANRDHPDVFTEELEQALQIIAALPGAGTLYAQSPVPGARRVSRSISDSQRTGCATVSSPLGKGARP